VAIRVVGIAAPPPPDCDAIMRSGGLRGRPQRAGRDGQQLPLASARSSALASGETVEFDHQHEQNQLRQRSCLVAVREASRRLLLAFWALSKRKARPKEKSGYWP
jgi:hypothetical protein